MSQRFRYNPKNPPTLCANCGIEVRVSFAPYLGALAIGSVLGILTTIVTGVGFGATAFYWVVLMTLSQFMGKLVSPAALRPKGDRLLWYKSPVFWLAIIVLPIIALAFL